MNKLDELSIFFPFWNEERNIEEVVRRAIPVASQVAKKWEIIMVDDGSSDKTLEIAKRLEAENNHLLTVSLHPNRGYGAALKAGFEHAKYSYIVFTDGDLQFDFSEVTRFVERIDEADIVIGFRQHRQDNFMRHLLMLLLKIWDYMFFQFYYRDIDCGFKMFRREALEQIMPLRSEGAMITTEILAKAKAKKLTVKQVGVTHYPRKFGDQSGGNLSVIIRAMLETLILFWDIKNRRF
ncbi:MAG: glycosyltransferase family 2 protein [Candidatus Levybacteria bacterium]|nr:glycosyltransferase family 2 protein [Candidatus Levybacteria bacterium]